MTVDTELRPTIDDAPAPRPRWVRVTALTAAVAVCLVAAVLVVVWRVSGANGTSYSSAAAIADRLGCADSFRVPSWNSAAPSESTVGTCSLNGKVLTLATFDSSDEAHAWLMAAMQFSPHIANGSPTVSGSSGANWAVTTQGSLGNGVGQVLGAN
jgi:hypothetical protein